MIFNYVLRAVCGIFAGVGIYQMIKGGSIVRPVRVIAALIVFVLAVVATVTGITYEQMRVLIETSLRR